MILGKFNETINPKTYKVEQNYKLDEYHHVIVARNKTDRNESRALRLRIGRAGYSQWLNELQVYLLPNFKHDNILPFLGFDKRYLVDSEDDDDNDDNNTEIFTSKNTLDEDEIKDESYQSHLGAASSADSVASMTTKGTWDDKSIKRKTAKKPKLLPTSRVPIEYWIVNDFSDCITLRHYIMMHTLNWSQMIRLARGIAAGLLYLHEHENWIESVTEDRATEGFVSSTHGAIKTIYFKSASHGTLKVAPPYHLTIVHRHLSSLNIVLRSDLTPCIWNFGAAHVYHPFQPINYVNYIDKPLNDLHQNSVYSAPEVLTKSSVYTLAAMKGVDMYAMGIIFWELISRCSLPPVEGASADENLDRRDPYSYAIPFKRELLSTVPTCNLLFKNIVERRVRPKIRPCWMVGKKSARYVRTICDLWDQDYDARIQVRTLIERLRVMSLDRDGDRHSKVVWLPPDPEPITAIQLIEHELSSRSRRGRPAHSGEGPLVLGEQFDYPISNTSESSSTTTGWGPPRPQPFRTHQPPGARGRSQRHGPAAQHQPPPPSSSENLTPQQRQYH
uniref:receptor protein serine/threonine kinase n=1 Tax=Aceria tosichella TaxID=561515 RepID=A0A6G1SHG0_9ACAR